MPKTSYRPRVGDTRWVVEWCIKAGLVDDEHPEYGGDPDANVMRGRFCLTKDEAERVAREVYPRDQFGAVSYWPVEFVPYDPDDARMYPHAGHWDATADAEIYEGEDQP